MHAAIFKTYVFTGEKDPKELLVEYLPESDMVIFSLNGKEVFNMSYTNDLESIVSGIESIRTLPMLD
ncbi:MAG: hypothetical protein OHK0053_34400 [Microscillaceae bacterium]